MSRLQQDQFVDDEEDECCPLCVEEFDLSDRNFRPCPCGYQICQFCYNNIKTTMNGLCPACRRPYDDSTIEWKTISPEEMTKHKQQIAQKAKKNAQIRQKEAQKAEADTLSRKHLAGLRVVQKNLVYVTGLTPTIREDRLLDTLRGPEYFGQYGKIIKIVVSKARENAQHQQSVGVYVTFARKEDAEQCIKAVDGSANGDRQLRAQYGTTKYCSAYLRGEQCNNRNCMFLHEPGEDNDSFTRQDLSMMNSIQTQQPSQSSSRAAPPAHPGPPVAAAAPMSRQDSNDTSNSSHEAPGLPATASWGSKAVLERRASRSTIASNPSPLVTNATPAQAAKVPKAEEAPKKKGKEREKKEEKETEKSSQTSNSTSPQRAPAQTPAAAPETRIPVARENVLGSLLKTICSSDFKFVFSSAAFTEEEFKAIVEFPQLLDPKGGAKRRAMREKEKELALQREAETEVRAPTQQASAAEREETEATAGGSLQLGGEPEDGNETTPGHLNHHAIAPPGQQGFGGSQFGQNSSLTEDFSSLGLSNRGLTTQQQQLLLSNFKLNAQSAGTVNAAQNMTASQHGLNANAPGHTRQTSRFSFANDNASASANVQPVANQKLMSQQNSMMPKNANHFGQMSQHQPLAGQFFTNVQGPPPGLKPTGTSPVGGTSMFGQGHGFATGGLPYGANAAGRNNNDVMYQDLLRGRNMDGSARVTDAGKHDTTFSAEEQASFNVDALVSDNEPDLEPARSVPSTPMSGQFFAQPRRATPTIPPGFSVPAVPRAIIEESKSRPGSRPMSRTTSTSITPAVPVLPVVPVTPIRTTTPSKSKRTKQAAEATPAPITPAKQQPETPTKSTTRPDTEKTPKASGSTGTSVEDAPVQKQHQNEDERKTSLEGASKESTKVKNSKKNPTAVEASPQMKTVKENVVQPKDTVTISAVTPVPMKRQRLGKLDTTSTTQGPTAEQSPATSSHKTDAQAKNVRATPVTSTKSVPASPAATATGSPIKRTVAPRTLRVVPTPKSEVPPLLSAVSAPPMPQIPLVDKLRSRQASIASVNMPGTPMSEMISDTASVTSASISRASSPPPMGGKVGSAPIRKKTKSQAKKDRQERKKQIEEELTVEENKSDVEVMQAPIIGRKKKTKKPATVPKLPSKSQPASPKPATVEDDHSDTPVLIPEAKASHSPKTSATATPDLGHFPESRDKRENTAQAIMADLQKTGELLASTLEFFKPLSSSLTHASRVTQGSSVSGPPDLKIHFSEADLEAVAKKKPVRLNGHDGRPDSRTLITPNGKFFWGLSEELEEKALKLEKQIEEIRGHARFHPRRSSQPRSTSGDASQSKDVLPAIATALKEAGKKLGDISTQQIPKLDVQSVLSETANESERRPRPPMMAQEMQQPPQPPQPQTPADAGAYLNQFVLPKTDNISPNQPRPEMAAVGGAPGAGTASISVNTGKFAKAAKAVVEGGAVGSTEIDGIGMMAADLLGGVFVQGLEALVGAGLGFEPSQEFGLDAHGNITLGRGGGGLDVQGLMNAIESTSGFGSAGGNRYGRGSVMSMEEAERAMHAARKEHDVLEKKLAALMKKNKRLFAGVGKV